MSATTYYIGALLFSLLAILAAPGDSLSDEVAWFGSIFMGGVCFICAELANLRKKVEGKSHE